MLKSLLVVIFGMQAAAQSAELKCEGDDIKFTVVTVQTLNHSGFNHQSLVKLTIEGESLHYGGVSTETVTRVGQSQLIQAINSLGETLKVDISPALGFQFPPPAFCGRAACDDYPGDGFAFMDAGTIEMNDGQVHKVDCL